MIKCNDCEDCYVNTNSDEAYCEANDGERIILHKGQCRPRWCPRNIHGKHADFMKIDEAVEGVDNNDLIKRSDAIDELMHIIPYRRYHNGAYVFLLNKKECLAAIKAAPSADRPQGEWIGEADGYADGELVYDTWYCSNCGYVVDDDEPPTWNFCPNCGCYNGGGQSD